MIRILRICLAGELLNLARLAWPNGEIEDIQVHAQLGTAMTVVERATKISIARLTQR